MNNWKNRFGKDVSPFLMLAIPFFVAVLVMGIMSGTELIQEKIQISASIIELPKANIFRVFFRL